MDIYTLIHNDHESAKSLMEQILAAGNHANRLALFERLKNAVVSHNEAEASSFYVALDAHLPMRQMADRSRHEHDEADAMMEKLSKSTMPAAQWEAEFMNLRQALLEHIEREESDVFSVARRTFSPRVSTELAIAMEQLKQMRMKILKVAS